MLITIGTDLLETFISPVDYTAQASDLAADQKRHWMHLEPHYSLTAANADDRLVLTPGSEGALLLWLLQSLKTHKSYRGRWPQGLQDLLPTNDLASTATTTGLQPQQLQELASRFVQAKKPLLIVGGVATGHRNGQSVALLGALLQWLTALPWDGLDFSAAENYSRVGDLLDLDELSQRLATDSIGVLFVSRCNPVRHSPKSLDLNSALAKAQLKVGLADLADDTTDQMDLILPLAHSLETWGDTEPRRGVIGLLQPLASP
ncbi:MAG: hypothetical protein BA871_05260 [Desulfuromonadales bacterium C00003096]|nr:MAG: hypothetical protein BA871_05260 [Desulfuromonadales bacterium C00003096]